MCVTMFGLNIWIGKRTAQLPGWFSLFFFFSFFFFLLFFSCRKVPDALTFDRSSPREEEEEEEKKRKGFLAPKPFHPRKPSLLFQERLLFVITPLALAMFRSWSPLQEKMKKRVREIIFNSFKSFLGNQENRRRKNLGEKRKKHSGRLQE